MRFNWSLFIYVLVVSSFLLSAFGAQDKPQDKPPDKPADKPAGKPAADKAQDKAQVKPLEKPAEKPKTKKAKPAKVMNNTPFDEECSSRDFFLPYSRGKFILKSSKGVVCPAPKFARVGFKTDKYYNLQELVSNDTTLPLAMSIAALRQDGIPNREAIEALDDFSVICTSLLFFQDTFLDPDLRPLYVRLFHAQPITLDSLMYLNFPRLLILNPGLTLDEFIGIVFKKFPQEELLSEYFRYWICDGIALPYQFNGFAVDSSDWTPVLKALFETFDDTTWFNMNFYMKRAMLRASYANPVRPRIDGYRAELRKQQRAKEPQKGLPTDPRALKNIVLLDPFRALTEIGFPLFDIMKELSSELGSNALQERTWFVKNAPDFKTFLYGKDKVSEVIKFYRTEKNLPDKYILELLTVAVSRQPILDVSRDAFDGYNPILLPLPNMWRIHPIKELALYLKRFSPEKALLNHKEFKMPLLLLRSILATADLVTYLRFETACMDYYLEEKAEAEKLVRLGKENKTENPTLDKSKVEPKKEEPKKEEPKKDVPKKDAPKKEESKEAPKKEEPKEAPKKDEPKKEGIKNDIKDNMKKEDAKKVDPSQPAKSAFARNVGDTKSDKPAPGTKPEDKSGAKPEDKSGAKPETSAKPEAPKTKTEAPKPEASKKEVPKTEAPKGKADAPKPSVPTKDAPKSEVPLPEAEAGPITIPGLEMPEDVPRGRNINSKGEPESFILHYVYRMTDVLEKMPQAKEILLESEETLCIFMERTKYLDRTTITGTDIGTKMYFKVMKTLETLLATYMVIPPPPPPTPEEMKRKEIERQLMEEERRRKQSSQKTGASALMTLSTACLVAIAAIILL